MPDNPGDPAPSASTSRRPPLWVGLALLLAGSGAALVSTAFDREAKVERLGGNEPVNAGSVDQLDLSAHNSPSLVRSPVDRSRLVVADRIDSPRYSCALHLSADAGASWSQVPIPLPAGEEPKCYAPDVAFGHDGTLYLSFVTLKGNGNVPSAVWISRLRGGRDRTLSRPRKVLGELSFQTRLVADPARAGRLYLTWLDAADVGLYRFTDPGNPIRAIRSDDGGRSWSAPGQVSDGKRLRVVAPSPQVGPDGELYVLYLDLRGDRLDYEGIHRGIGGTPYQGTFELVLARSTDRGKTFAESVVDTEVRPTERFLAFLPAAPSLAVDRGSGRIYAAYQDNRHGDPDVMLWTRAKDASGWTGPIRVNDTPERDGSAQYLPRLSLAPDGRLDVIYYDRRKDPTNLRNEVSLQSSYDHADSFTGRLALTNRPFDSRIGFGAERDMPDIGSRLASLSTNERTLAVWTDTRNGKIITRKQDQYRAVAVHSAPDDLPGRQKDLLRYGGIALALLGLALAGREIARPQRKLTRVTE